MQSLSFFLRLKQGSGYHRSPTPALVWNNSCILHQDNGPAIPNLKLHCCYWLFAIYPYFENENGRDWDNQHYSISKDFPRHIMLLTESMKDVNRLHRSVLVTFLWKWKALVFPDNKYRFVQGLSLI